MTDSRVAPAVRVHEARPRVLAVRVLRALVFFVGTNWAWLALGVICLVLSFLLVWERGFYSDDFAIMTTAVDPITGLSTRLLGPERNPFYPARLLNLALGTSLVQMVDHDELLLRLLCSAAFVLSAVAGGLLVRRVLGSRLAALIAGAVLLVPIFGHEATLWIASIPYVIAVGIGLWMVDLLVAESFVESPRWSRMVWVGVLACSTLSLIESVVLILGLVPLLVCARALRSSTGPVRVVKRSLLVCSVPAGAVLLLTVVTYGRSSMFQQRGGLISAPSELIDNVQATLGRARWMLFGEWGGQIRAEAFFLGLERIGRSWASWLAACGIVLALVSALRWRPDRNHARRPNAAGWVLLIAGCLWGLTAVLLPGALIKEQMLEFRILYLSWPGVAMAAGAVAWLVARGPAQEKVAVGLAGILVLLGSIVMLGNSLIYDARNELDTHQIKALVNEVPSDALPRDAVIVPFALSDRLFEVDHVADTLLIAALETTWGTKAVLLENYRRRDIHQIVSNRWLGWTFDFREADGGLSLQGVDVPIDRTLLFTVRTEGFFAIDRLVVVQDDGGRHEIAFPLAAPLERWGTPTMAVTVRDEVAEFEWSVPEFLRSS